MAVLSRIEEIKEVLVLSSDPEFDKLLKGMVRAFNEILEFEPEIDEEIDEIQT